MTSGVPGSACFACPIQIQLALASGQFTINRLMPHRVPVMDGGFRRPRSGHSTCRNCGILPAVREIRISAAARRDHCQPVGCRPAITVNRLPAPFSCHGRQRRPQRGLGPSAIPSPSEIRRWLRGLPYPPSSRHRCINRRPFGCCRCSDHPYDKREFPLMEITWVKSNLTNQTN